MVTRNIEYRTGRFYEKIVSTEKGKSEHTEKKEQKDSTKVVLGEIGRLQFYTYPYDYPDKVFVGIYPFSQPLGSIQEANLLFGITNKIRWYLKGTWHQKPKHRKSRSKLKEKCLKAYDKGLERMIAKQKEVKLNQTINDTRRS